MSELSEYQSKLIEKNVDLAHYLAQLTWARNPEVFDIDELVSAAYQGLISAAKKFDPTRTDEDSTEEKAFSGYARQRIRGAMLDWMRNQDHVPRNKRITYKNFQKAGHGSGKSLDEIADITGTPIEKVRSIVQVVEATSFSLDSEYLPEELSNSDTVESTASENRLRTAMVFQWASLSPLQQVIISLRYYKGMEFSSIASELGLRLVLVKQEHEEAVLILHSALKATAV